MKRWCVGSAIIPLVVLVGGIRDKFGSGTLTLFAIIFALRVVAYFFDYLLMGHWILLRS